MTQLSAQKKLELIRSVLNRIPDALESAPPGAIDQLYNEATSAEARADLLLQREALVSQIADIDRALEKLK